MHDLALNAHWLLFEPQTQCWEEIKRNVGALGIRYSLENRLLFHTSDVDRLFYVVQGTDCLTGSSIYPEKGRELTKCKHKTISIDDCFAAHRLDGASAFIKMDIQGAELDCLQGADHALSNTVGILCEANILDYNQGSPSYHELDTYLAGKGFRLADIAGSARLKDGRLNQLDLLYLPANSPMMSI
jgi:FkbM family methyltransferase